MAMPISLPLVAALGLLLAAVLESPRPISRRRAVSGTASSRPRRTGTGSASPATRRPPGRPSDYLLYRAAELTVQTGHDWFQVVDRDTVQEDSGNGGSPAFGVGVGGGSDVGVGLSFPMGGGGGSGRYSADMGILVQDGKPQDDAESTTPSR